MNWPQRGVYFFTEACEERNESGNGPRVVRVGTHALKLNGRTTLWNRLSQHRGRSRNGRGNHRGSIFRLIVGKSLMARDGYNFPTWGDKSSASREARNDEVRLEEEVSRVIGAMPFLWLPINDEPGPESLRGLIERNSIALLSNYGREKIDPASDNWLGHHCDRARVRSSGLWNSNHVDEPYDPAFLDKLERLVDHAAVR